jgi:hypothetical protein
MANQVSKLNYVDAKLGAPTSGQQTTRYIYDSVLPGAGGTNVTFFQNFAGKTQFQTNLTTNKLDSMESMVIKSIYLALYCWYCWYIEFDRAHEPQHLCGQPMCIERF